MTIMTGIIDGGHNALAIANFLIVALMDQKVKTWEECKEFWDANYDEILDRFQNHEGEFKFSVPIEIISPNYDEGAIDDYYDHPKEICSARNNNVHLTEVAKGNQSGFYDYLKEILGDEFTHHLEKRRTRKNKVRGYNKYDHHPLNVSIKK